MMAASKEHAVVVVLMSVYNGAAWLNPQLESIISQTLQPTLILIRDDGSSDASSDILSDYRLRYPQQIQLLDDGLGNLGPAQSFSRLMQHAMGITEPCSERAYFSLSDQDDIWYPDKTARLLERMLEVEQSLPPMPILVHSDLRVVDDRLHELAPSFIQSQGLSARRQGLAAALVSNAVTGCSALLNRELLKLALPVPAQAMMHDFWLALVAEAFGRREFVEQPLLDYRQHGSNTLGARPRLPFSLAGLRQRLSTAEQQRTQQIYRELAAQATVFRHRYAEILNDEQSVALGRVERLPDMTLIRQKCMFRYLRDLSRVSRSDRI